MEEGGDDGREGGMDGRRGEGVSEARRELRRNA